MSECRSGLQGQPPRGLLGGRGWERGEAEGLKEQAGPDTNAFQGGMCVCVRETDRLKIFLRRQKVDSGCQGLGGEMGRFVFKGYRLSVWDDENVFKMDGGNGCTTV